MQISIVEPRPVENHVFKLARLPLLGPIYLGTILKNAGHEVRVFNEGISTPYNDKTKIFNEYVQDSDLLLLTGLSSTIKRAYFLAKEFKKLDNKKVMIGGIHASFEPIEALRYADYVMVGEGEKTIIDAVNSIERDNDTRMANNRIIKGEPLCDLDELPYPELALVENHRRIRPIPVQTSRGCPFCCKFCAVTKMFGRRYRHRSVDNIIGELRLRQGKEIFFYDDNFTADTNHSKELFRKMIEERLGIKWGAQVRADVTRDKELVDLMAESGCYKVYIGFESINPKTLIRFNKSQAVDDIKSAIRILHDRGISIHGMFVVGSDDDDKNTVRRTADFCNDFDIDTTQIMILTPLPGTDTFFELDRQKRIFTKDWNYYDGQHVVFKPRLMSPLELQLETLDAMKRFYSVSQGIKLALKNSVMINLFLLRNWFSKHKKQLPDLRNAAYKFVGNRIIHSWEKHNKSYLEYLSRVTESFKKWKDSLPEVNLPKPFKNSA